MKKEETNTFIIPKPLTLAGLERELKTFVQPPVDRWSPGDPVPVSEWIVGQYNKLLPAKVSCRAIAHIFLDWPDGVELENLTEVSQQAAAMGDILKEVDARYGLNRDRAISTAFPSSKDRSSLVRYAHHFVGQINRRRELSGLLVDFKLINTVGHGLPHIRMTEKGWRFAVLPNPILDGAPLGDEVERFYSEEVEFLLSLIRDFIPREDYAYRTIMRAIMEGAATPTSLDHRLQEVTPKVVDKDLTQDFLSSQRAGVIFRMADLGLVTRTRKGVKVVYGVTSIGEGYLLEK